MIAHREPSDVTITLIEEEAVALRDEIGQLVLNGGTQLENLYVLLTRAAATRWVEI